MRRAEDHGLDADAAGLLVLVYDLMMQVGEATGDEAPMTVAAIHGARAKALLPEEFTH